MAQTSLQNSRQLSGDVATHLRALAHDLSNALETILQASYLLQQTKQDENSKKWTQLIATAADDAARLNREIREILKKQG